MYRTIQNAWLFRLVYDTAPCSNILGCIVICIHRMATIFAAKSFPGSFAHMQTMRTHLRSVSSGNGEQLNSGKLGLIRQVLPQLIKTPTIEFCLLALAFWLCRPADFAQFLNSNPLSFCFCFLYDLFAYIVIVYGNEPAFSATKPSQDLFSSPRAFALNAGSYFIVFYTNIFEGLGIEISAVRKSTNICLTEIATDKMLYIFFDFFRHFNGLKDVKFCFPKYQIGLPFYVRKIIYAVANKRNITSSVNCPQRNPLLQVRQYSGIVSNCPQWPKLPFHFSIKGIGISNLGNTPYNHLSRKIKFLSNTIIGLSMQFELIKKFFAPGYFGNCITSSIRFLDRLKQRFSLIWTGQQLYFQGEIHHTKIIPFFEIVKRISNSSAIQACAVSLP
jgi:hypothetical protein